MAAESLMTTGLSIKKSQNSRGGQSVCLFIGMRVVPVNGDLFRGHILKHR
jgi:hypothetical protein